MKNKMRLSLLVAGVVGFCNVTFAQSVDQGKKFLYYQRYKSAKDVFDKILASNPNDINAVYWQGQTLIDMKDSAAAEELYSKALQSNGSAPLLLVGMGNIELRKGKTADARQRFETALSLTKSKDVDVLNAIADANIDAKAGDATYAVEKLNLATQQKKFNSPETYTLMGDAYRKLIDGGNAVQSYQKALTIDPKYAEAKYKIGKIYLTQNNKEYFLPAFEEAIQLDPAYAPAYYELYYYYALRDVNKAGEYLDKYAANADAGPEVEAMKIDMKYNQGKFAEAKAAAQSQITSLGAKAPARLYKLIAYASDTLGDLASAKQNIDLYFQHQDTALIIGGDYAERANISSKATDTATKLTAFADYKLAIARDSVPEYKQRYINSANDLAKKLGNKSAAAEVAAIVYNTKKNPTNTDLYNWGFANYSAGNYKTADSIFCGLYIPRYPNEIYGYLWCANSKLAQDDSLSSGGLAVEAFDKLGAKARELDSTAKAAGSADSVKYKSQVLKSYFYLASYYNNTKKDKETALLYLNKVLEVDPENATAKQYITAVSAKPKPAAKPAAGGAKPKSGK